MVRVMLIPRGLLTFMLIAVLLFRSVAGSHGNLSIEECSLSLNFTAVGLNSLPDGFLKNNFLTHLILDENEIPSITTETFSSLPRLSYLSLARNKLTGLNIHSFSKLHDLDTLNLNGNCKAQPIRKYPTQRSDNYDYYDRYYHTTTTPPPPTYEIDDSCRLRFDGRLQSLTHLFVENNDLKKLVFNFGELPVLTHLYLSHNPLEMNEQTIAGLNTVASALTHLYLQNCDMVKFYAVQFPTVTSLYLDDNKIQSICNTDCGDSALKLNAAQQLEILSVSHNRISKIDADSFIHTTNLLSLDLSNNEIAEIEEGTFDKLYLLKSLSLEHNKLVQLSAVDTFKDLIKLENLFLGGNDISDISGDLFENLSTLKKLMLNNTKISSLDSGMFSKLANLEVLSLAGNRLTEIPQGIMPTSGSLTTLDLDNNNFISTDDISLTDGPKLLSLSLKNNPLQTITAKWIAGVGSENLTIILSHTPSP